MYLLKTGTIATAFAYLVLAAVISILINALNQVLFPKRNQPPVVFHWVPWLGSAIEYGMDPFKFYSRNRQKASALIFFLRYSQLRKISMETSLHLFCLAVQQQYASAAGVTTSSLTASSKMFLLRKFTIR